jgi:galactoside O-acetyltransferase
MLRFLISLKKWYLKNTIFKKSNIVIHKCTTVDYRFINLKKNCHLLIDENSIIEGHLIFERERASISIGKRTFIGHSNIICAENISIGDDVLVAWGCNIVDHNSHSKNFQERQDDVKQWYYGQKDWTNVICRPIVIEDKAWIGFNSIILKGVTIGEGAIVGAGSVVTKDIPPYTIVAGNPAQILRTIREDER